MIVTKCSSDMIQPLDDLEYRVLQLFLTFLTFQIVKLSCFLIHTPWKGSTMPQEFNFALLW